MMLTLMLVLCVFNPAFVDRTRVPDLCCLTLYNRIFSSPPTFRALFASRFVELSPLSPAPSTPDADVPQVRR